MATLFNNTEITNAFFNGTELDKIYFNGVLIFEKGGKYKRRIMVGDNLKDKKIFLKNYSEDFYDLIYKDGGYGTSYLIEFNNSTSWDNLIYQNILYEGDDPLNFIVTAGYIDTSFVTKGWKNIYSFNKKVTPVTYEINSPLTINNDKDYLVTKCYDKVAYRCLFIEDENIRPIQEGDIILSTTKIYLTFPDNFYESNSVQMPPILTANSSDNNINAWLWYTSDTITGGGVPIPISIILSVSGMSGYNGEDWYQLDSNNSNIETNISYTTLPLTQPIIVDSIDTSQSAKNIVQNILVDTRTLGTSGYKRRIMVGDNLKGKIIYQDFPQNYNENEKFVGTTGYTFNEIVVIDATTRITESYYNSEEGVYVETDNMADGNRLFYYFDIAGSIPAHVDNVTCKNDKDYVVRSIIDDNSSYKHLYIEDNKIRPLQVGDKIIGDTKLYFNFPDNFRDELPQYSLKILDIIFLNENNSDTTRKLNLTYATNNITKCKVSYYKKPSVGAGWNSNENATIFDLEKKRNLSFILAKDMNALESVGFTGIVSTINESSPAYKYILVDITTLG